MAPKGLTRCPLTWGLFLGTVALGTIYFRNQKKENKKNKKTNSKELPSCTVMFVVGGPGTGKGTQCQMLVDKSDWVHLSAGDLLRAERKRAKEAKEGDNNADLELGRTIESCINAGKIVPSSITVRLLEKGMKQAYQSSGATKFLVDGFPRGQDNIDAWDNQMKAHTVTKVLNFECPEEVLVGRLLERGKSSGRSDDNIDTIRKRFQTHVEACKPVLARYEKDGILETISSDQPVEDVYKQVEKIVLGLPSCTVMFVVGGPGTGKGTQCQMLVDKSDWVHLSAGDLLRAERKRAKEAKEGDNDADLELGRTIESCINAGKIVPSSITVRLLEKGMKQAYQSSGATKFLVDGFPRGQDNIDAWDNQMKAHTVTKVLNFECPEEVLVERLLERGKSSGRSDDNIDTIRKRFQTHVEACKPVLARYEKDGILETIGSDQPVEDVYKHVEKIVLGTSNGTNGSI